MEETKIKFGYIPYQEEGNEYLHIVIKNRHYGVSYSIDAFEEKVVLNIRYGNRYGIHGGMKSFHLREMDLSMFEKINEAFFPFMYGNEELPGQKIDRIIHRNLDKNSIEFLVNDISPESKEIIKLLQEAFLAKKLRREEIHDEVQELLNILISNLDCNIGKKMEIKERIRELDLKISSLQKEKDELVKLLK